MGLAALELVGLIYSYNPLHPHAGTISSDIELKKNKDDDGTTITRTVISSNIALKETLCYQISYNHTNKYTGKYHALQTI